MPLGRIAAQNSDICASAKPGRSAGTANCRPSSGAASANPHARAARSKRRRSRSAYRPLSREAVAEAAVVSLPARVSPDQAQHMRGALGEMRRRAIPRTSAAARAAGAAAHSRACRAPARRSRLQDALHLGVVQPRDHRRRHHARRHAGLGQRRDRLQPPRGRGRARLHPPRQRRIQRRHRHADPRQPAPRHPRAGCRDRAARRPTW